ncbi:MAG: AraC family transcriptional regulator [Clostridia bacterium]|jgi:AraC-like DNA-binding protein|nr:AraC family transcriptional regulator [Clostridia bacterium]MCI2015131.1 AraC family transcriptional regulator [Clostridia bacterium]
MKTIKMQNVYCSEADYSKLCTLDIDVIEKHTAPLIHQMSRFWYIIDGHGILKLQDREYELKKGTLVSVLPWQITDIISVESPIRYYLLIYYFDNINSVIKSFYSVDEPLNIIECLHDNPVIYCNEEQQKNIERILSCIKDEIGLESINPPDFKSGRLSSVFVTNKIIELILIMIRHRMDGDKKKCVVQKSDILYYMYCNLDKKLTLKRLSALFFMSESSISSYLTKITGLSFFDLLNEMRVGKTVNFLLYTDFTMDELAEILGFVDSSHICKVFAARVGMRANQYRKTYQNVEQMCMIRLGKSAYKIVEYIYRNSDRIITIQDVAVKFSKTTKEVNSILLYLVEKNFTEFLNFVRINKACVLLKTTDLTIMQTAVEVGYGNTKTFTRYFLKFRTMTPRDFRKNVKFHKHFNTIKQ